CFGDYKARTLLPVDCGGLSVLQGCQAGLLRRKRTGASDSPSRQESQRLLRLITCEEKSRMERNEASDYPQELLDLFHEYQHGDIDRRTFLDRAARFAVGGLTVAAIFEGLKPNYAWAQQVPPDDKRIKVGREVV